MNYKKIFNNLVKEFKKEYTPFFKQMVKIQIDLKGDNAYKFIVEQLLSQFSDVSPSKANKFKNNNNIP